MIAGVGGGGLKPPCGDMIGGVNTDPRPVPYRTIIATVAIVLATVLLLLLVRATAQVLTWIAIAAFFAVALYPAVNWLEARARWIRRSVATLLVFLTVVLAILGLITVFVLPLVSEARQLAGQVPQLIDDARAGRGTVGGLLQRFHVLDWVRQHQDQIQGWLSNIGGGALGVVQSAATSVAAALTIFVLSYLMVLEGPKIVRGTLALFDDRRRAERVRRVGADCARTITGYLTGNLLISIIAGAASYVVLLVLGVPYAGLLALFVGIADLIPLVGATLGAVVVSAAAFTQGLKAGIIVVVFFIVYQQVENHLLQPVIYSRTVQLNPLTALVAVLLFSDLSGLLGALLAIPLAGMIQIILRDIWDHRRGRLKEEPTVGEDRRPAIGAETQPT
jgi:predicted PurR-regulated permease PerM